MKIQDLSDFIDELKTVKLFLANLGLLIFWRLFAFFFMFADYFSIIEQIESLYF